MDDCCYSYCNDVRYRVGACFCTNKLNSLPKQYYPDGIAITQTIQQVAGAIGIAVMVSILSAKQSSYLASVGNEPTQAAASGSLMVFTISVVLAVINVVLSLFIKKPR
jgi:DHA2 family lincomycin resistance protein-like MFS transporter